MILQRYTYIFIKLYIYIYFLLKADIKTWNITFCKVAARYETASFSINGNGFVCLGRTYSNNMTNEIWEYNTVNQ
jgi:hypothetical protein